MNNSLHTSFDETLEDNSVTLSTADHVILAFSFVFPLCIAIWTAFKGKKTTQDFFTANKSMGAFPVALSVISTLTSAYLIISCCGEVYSYGLEYSVTLIGSLVGIPLFYYMILKTFYDLKVASIYEYLERRFNSPRLRVCLVLLDIIGLLFPMGVGLCGICLILSSVTSVGVNTYIIILGTVCAIYATIGGMRGVIWTDAFMMIVILVGLVAVIAIGSLDLGPLEVWEIARQGGRTRIFNFNPSLFQRQNFYLLFLYGFLMHGKIYSTSQSALQRVYSLKSYSQFKWVLVGIICVLVTVKVLMFWTGLTAYSLYAGCDPVKQKKIEKSDQILPYLISDKMGHIPGISGIFLAAMVSAGVSTLTSIMAAFSNLVYSDLLCKLSYFRGFSAKKSFILCKILTLSTALPSIGIAFIATKAGNILPFIMIILGLFGGPSFGVFLLGLLFPMTKLVGVIAGFFASSGVLSWILVGMVIYKPREESLPLSTELCNITDLNATYEYISENLYAFSSANNTVVTSDDEFSSTTTMYNVSYLFFGAFGPIICVFVGLCVSYLQGAEKVRNVPEEFISPMVRRFYYKKTTSQICREGNEMKNIDQQNS